MIDFQTFKQMLQKYGSDFDYQRLYQIFTSALDTTQSPPSLNQLMLGDLFPSEFLDEV